MKDLLALLAVLLAPLGALSAAELKLAAVFADHMVLQRDMPVPVWGWASAGEKSLLSLRIKRKRLTADDGGKWLVELAPCRPSPNRKSSSLRTAKSR